MGFGNVRPIRHVCPIGHVCPKRVWTVLRISVFLCFLLLYFVQFPPDIQLPDFLCHPAVSRKCVGSVARQDESSASIRHERHVNNRYEMENFREINRNSYTETGLATCSWAVGEPLYLPNENDDLEQMMITWLNEFNITYTLNDGSLLGAYRHQGKIPDDYDLDIILPVWLNFGCNEKNFINETNQQQHQHQQQQQQQQQHIFCNASNPKIMDNVIAAFDEQIRRTSAPFYTSKKSYGFRLWRKKLHFFELNFYADVQVAIRNRGKPKALFREKTCKCRFRSVPAQCIEPAVDRLRDEYKQTEEELLMPHIFKNQRIGARNAYEDRSLKNPLHPKWKFLITSF